jgi:Fe-S-cluster-containing dehydrogenase component
MSPHFIDDRDRDRDDDVVLPFERADATRRSFLRLAGFGVASTFFASCSRAPESKLVVPAKGLGGATPGRSYRVATACDACPAACGVLATCRDGRPIKLEGLPGHPTSAGGLCAVGQADVLSLYDSKRFATPRRGGVAVGRAAADRALAEAFDGLARSNGRVRILTGTRNGPTELAAIESFLKRFADGKHVVYDALSASAILDAHARTHGERALPAYRIERAETLVVFEADPFGTWIDPVRFGAARAEARRRGFDGRRPRHVQFEARVSPTGDCADVRRTLAPSDLPAAIVALRDAVVDLSRGGEGRVPDAAPQAKFLADAARALFASKGRSLVLCGRDDVAVQTVVNEINHALDGYGATLDLARASRARLGSAADLETLRVELDNGAVDALIVAGANPAYDLPGEGALGGAIRKAKLLISTAPIEDETSALADWIAPEPHALSAWGDAEPIEGLFALRQPCAPVLRDAATLPVSLSKWSGANETDESLVKKVWKERVWPRVGGGGSFERFFKKAAAAGFVAASGGEGSQPRFRQEGVLVPELGAAPPKGAYELVLHPNVSMGDGRHAHNPWLHELPDPVSRVAWDNDVSAAPATAKALGLSAGDVVRLTSDDGVASVELGVRIQPGQREGVLAAAIGYGRAGTDRFTDVGPDWFEARPTVEIGGVVGVSVARFGAVAKDGARFVRVAKTGRRRDVACVQEHHSLEVPAHLAPRGGAVRDAAREIKAGQTPHYVDMAAGLSAWPQDHVGPRRLGMAVDLDACSGCGACVVACQAENNVPVVGRDEVRRNREMSWIRIDRYASGDGDDLRTIRQPMMCQHCGNAPCEAVCPVLATAHSADGLNQQVYNRCVGTRYCANNCPYKTRRFNWFDYASRGDLENHALNPDVTVRSRGVMEKCTMCVQRIEDAKAEAKRLGRPLQDGDATPACAQTCAARAIVFGDLADPNSAVSALAREPRAYGALDETGVSPGVRYLALVRNDGREG